MYAYLHPDLSYLKYLGRDWGVHLISNNNLCSTTVRSQELGNNCVILIYSLE